MKGYSAPSPKEERVKYIRALERFVGSCMSSLKGGEFDLARFEKRAKKSLEVVRKVKPARLDAHYLNLLEAYVALVESTLAKPEMERDEKHRILLKEANLIEKERNQSSYKKSKHTKNDFEDGY